jgi:hypothetical protein
MLPDDLTREALRRLYDSGHKLVYEFAGAGSPALAWLHSVGGSSRLLLEAADRYSPGSLAELIGAAPDKAVSAETAARMAEAAYRRAVRLSDGASPCVGLACTATIATDRAKRGDHACHVAVRDRAGRTDYQLVLTKGARDRAGEETVIARLIVHALACACGVGGTTLELPAGEAVCAARHNEADPLHHLLDAQARTVTVYPDRRQAVDEPFAGAVLSGSFNPLHCGHETMLRVAGKFMGLPVAYELPVVNADKPTLTANEVQRRVDQFRRYPVILTRAPLFIDKAALFLGATFVVGYDTAVRLVDPRYYGGEAAARDAAMSSIQGRGCRFLVAARPMPDGVRTLADVAVPPAFAALFVELPRSEFLLDLSSTELRSSSP